MNPSQLMNSDAMAATLFALGGSYDMVVIDSAPLLPVADTLPLTRITDGAVIVTKFNSTKRGQLQSALQVVEAVNGSVLGLVINRVKKSKREKHYGYESRIEPNSLVADFRPRSGRQPQAADVNANRSV
ncbi:tyrosine-protein kinase family protein [Arthrobacter psychrolactophilus]